MQTKHSSCYHRDIIAYKRAATRPTAIKRPPALVVEAAPVKATVVFDLGDTGRPDGVIVPTGPAGVLAADGVTVITLV